MNPVNMQAQAVQPQIVVKEITKDENIKTLMQYAKKWAAAAAAKIDKLPPGSAEAIVARDCAGEAEAILSQLKVVKKEKGTVFAAIVDGKIEGIAIAKIHGKSGKASELDNMVVNPERIKLLNKDSKVQGIGTAMINKIVSKIWHKQDARKELHAIALDSAELFYQKLGFKTDYDIISGVLGDGYVPMKLDKAGMENLRNKRLNGAAPLPNPNVAAPKPNVAAPKPNAAAPKPNVAPPKANAAAPVAIGKTKVEHLQAGKINPFQVTYKGKTTAQQAQEIVTYLESAVKVHPDALIAITYAANAKQTDDILAGYKLGQCADISGSNQAEVFKLVSKAINATPHLKGKVIIAPVTTCQYVGGKRVSPTAAQVNKSMENIHHLLRGNHAHVKGGKVGGKCIMLGLQNEEAKPLYPYAIGTGVAAKEFAPFKGHVNGKLVKWSQETPGANYHAIK